MTAAHETADAARPRRRLGFVARTLLAYLSLAVEHRLPASLRAWIQRRRLRHILDHARAQVPHHRDAWRSIDLADVRAPGDLGHLPPLERRTIATEPDRMVAASRAGMPGLHTARTTGSTGSPLGIVYDDRDYARGRALAQFGQGRSGRTARDVVAHLLVPDAPESRGPLARLGIGRTVRIDLLAGVEANLTALRELQPDVLYGYPSHLTLLAKAVLADDDRTIQPRLVITNGEVLAEPARRLIADAFAADVRDSYGSTEFHQIAYGCGDGRLHVLPWLVVEIDAASIGPDGAGDVLVTSLYHRTMPLIRYRLGDRAVLRDTPCPCGDASPVIETVVGRADDFVTLPSGQVISARAVNLLDDIAGLLEYQIIQRSREHFDVLVTPIGDVTDATRAEIRRRIVQGCLGEQVDVEVVIRDQIPRSRTGKRQAVVSEAT